MWRAIVWFILLQMAACAAAAEETRNILITGGIKGLGREIADYFAEQGYKVYVTSRTPDKYAKILHLQVVELDLQDLNAIDVAIKKIIVDDGKLDILINNAGSIHLGAFETISTQDAKELFAVNYFAACNMTAAVLPYMRQQHYGHIINISSTSTLSPMPGLSHYTASKIALEGMSIALATEVSPWNIKIKVLQPGSIRSIPPSIAAAVPNYSSVLFQNFNRNLLLYLASHQEQGEAPQDIARLVLQIVEHSDDRIIIQTTQRGAAIAKLVSSDINREQTFKYQCDFMQQFGSFR